MECLLLSDKLKFDCGTNSVSSNSVTSGATSCVTGCLSHVITHKTNRIFLTSIEFGA